VSWVNPWLSSWLRLGGKDDDSPRLGSIEGKDDDVLARETALR